MAKILLLLTLILCFFQIGESISCEGEAKNTEIRLRRKLFCNYDKSVRPVSNFRNKTMVKMKMIVKTFKFHDADEQLQVNSWIVLSWKDEGLKWEPKEYENIQIVYEPSSDIWIPDISLYNSESGQNMESCRTTECLIYPTGTVVCIPPCSHTGYCKSDFSRWPYDRQNCTFSFGTWTSSGEEVDFDIKKTTIDSKSHQMNTEWKLISTKVNKKVGNYSCCPGQTFPSLKFNFVLERHSSTHFAVLLSPLYIMIFLNLAALLIHTQCSSRLIVMSLNLVLHFMFIQQLSWYVPQNGEDIPTIITMFRDSTIISGFLIIFTILMRLVIAMDYSPPTWVDGPIDMISSNRIGQVFMSSEVENKRLDVETTDDSANLVTSPPIVRPIKAKSTWEVVAKFLNFLLFIILIVVYFIMMLALLPFGYLAGDVDGVQIDETTNTV